MVIIPSKLSIVGQYLSSETAGIIIDLIQAGLDELDSKIRKNMSANRVLHPQSDVDRLYQPRKIKGR